MRVAIVDTYYPAFVRSFYGRQPGLEGEPYERQLAALVEESFGTSDAYSFHLRALGHEAIDLIVDCEPLQLRWAEEQGLHRLERRALGRIPGRFGPLARRRLLQRIARRQIDEFEPDVVFCHNLTFFPRSELDALRAAGRLVVGQIASPLPDEDQLRGFDLVLTSFPHFVDRLKRTGVDSEYFRLAVDPRVLDRLRAKGTDPAATSNRPVEIAFVGGVSPNVHAAGTRLLEEVCARLPVDVWGYGAEALSPESPIRRRYRGEAWGLDMYRALASSKIALNRHIDVAEGHANNMRLYEATAMGAALLTDRSSNLDELFAPGREVATYESVAELADEIEELLAGDADRIALAEAGQRRTLTEHTFAARMAELAELLQRRL
jgi:glycosyltransferase involved in cell wall biosynthesis